VPRWVRGVDDKGIRLDFIGFAVLHSTYLLQLKHQMLLAETHLQLLGAALGKQGCVDAKDDGWLSEGTCL